jgi:hypothetical protein
MAERRNKWVVIFVVLLALAFILHRLVQVIHG